MKQLKNIYLIFHNIGGTALLQGKLTQLGKDLVYSKKLNDRGKINYHRYIIFHNYKTTSMSTQHYMYQLPLRDLLVQIIDKQTSMEELFFGFMNFGTSVFRY